MKTIYVAGKVNGTKWQLVDLLNKKHPNYLFTAAGDHPIADKHCADWKEQFLGLGVDTGNEVFWQVAAPIDVCDQLIAYLDTADAYGSIAEIALAVGHGKRCTVFLSSPDAQREAFADAYSLVVNLPLVTVHTVEKVAEAAHLLRFAFAVESPIEGKLYLAMNERRWVRECEPQYVIGRYRLDFAFPAHKLAIECDGQEFHASQEQRERDAERDRFLLKEGWRTMRFTGSQIHRNAISCADEIYKILHPEKIQPSSHLKYGHTI